jgi:hypothetical protein
VIGHISSIDPTTSEASDRARLDIEEIAQSARRPKTRLDTWQAQVGFGPMMDLGLVG